MSPHLVWVDMGTRTYMAHRHESPAMIHGASDPRVTLTDTGDLSAKLLI